MDVREAIATRRARRALRAQPVDDATVLALADAVRLSPSALNCQPWRLVFVRRAAVLHRLCADLPDYNHWARNASMIIAVCGQPSDDPAAREGVDIRGHVPRLSRFGAPQAHDVVRPLLMLDLGIATAFLMLRATELGLVAHPIAGFLQDSVRAVLEVPSDHDIGVLVVVGTATDAAEAIAAIPVDERHDEHRRPHRMPVELYAFADRYGEPVAGAGAGAGDSAR